MNEISKVLLSPHVTEKGTYLAMQRKYVFRVGNKATKKDIKRVIATMFKVEVQSVAVCNILGKRKRFGQIQGRRKNWKKVYVTLKEGQAIDLS